MEMSIKVRIHRWSGIDKKLQSEIWEYVHPEAKCLPKILACHVSGS